MQYEKSQAEGMHVDSADDSLQAEEIERADYPGDNQLLIQAKQEYRAPLLDCTNKLHQATETGKKDGTNSKKGQWKRRARMQCFGQAQGASDFHSDIPDGILKRDRGGRDEC